MLSKIRQKKTNIVQFHLHEAPRAVKYIDRMVITRGWGWEMGSYYLSFIGGN